MFNSPHALEGNPLLEASEKSASYRNLSGACVLEGIPLLETSSISI